LPGPLVGLASRFQAYYAAENFLGAPIQVNRKKAGLILNGGGDGSTNSAVKLSGWLFNKMNAYGYEEHTVISHKTNKIPVMEDTAAVSGVRRIADFFNGE
jgi:hypothetical protein